MRTERDRQGQTDIERDCPWQRSNRDKASKDRTGTKQRQKGTNQQRKKQGLNMDNQE